MCTDASLFGSRPSDFSLALAFKFRIWLGSVIRICLGFRISVSSFLLEWAFALELVLLQAQRPFALVIRHGRIWIAHAGQISRARFGQERREHGIIAIQLLEL